MRRLRRKGPVALLAASLVVLAGCGAFRERSLCSQYEDFRAAIDEVQALDPTTATGEDVTEVVDGVLAELDQLLAASDGVYDATISDLRASLTEFREAAFALSTTEIDAARPLLEDFRDDVVIDYQVLTQRLDVACTTD